MECFVCLFVCFWAASECAGCGVDDGVSFAFRIEHDQAEKKRMKLTSFKGRVMGLPLGLPTGAWIWAAARPAKTEMMEALVNMLTVVFDYRIIARIVCEIK